MAVRTKHGPRVLGPHFLTPKKERTEDTIMLINSNSQSGNADRKTRISFFGVCLWRHSIIHLLKVTLKLGVTAPLSYLR